MDRNFATFVQLKDTETKTERKELKKQKYNPMPKPIYIKVHCTKCGKNEDIRTNNPELYTEEVKKNWICILCKGFKKKENKDGPTETDNTIPEQQGQ
jgi:hypothetical protein